MIKNFNKFNNINEGKNFDFLKQYGIEKLVVDSKILKGLDLETYFETIFKPNNNLNWLLKAKIKDAIIEVIDFNSVVWHNGTWLDGSWKDGIWVQGIWKSGTWHKGIWEYGIWKNGTWEDGIWQDGIWQDGIWLNGEGKPENA